MMTVTPTRSALLAKRSQLRTARQGRELLEQKKDALWLELRKSMDAAALQTGELQKQLFVAQGMLLKSVGHDGTEALRSLSFVTRQDCSVDVKKQNVAGVSCPDIEHRSFQRHATERKASLISVSAYCDLTALHYEKVLEVILKQTEIETRLRRLALEIRRVNIRVNALAQIVEPKLSREQMLIALSLEEREREEGYIVKRFAK